VHLIVEHGAKARLEMEKKTQRRLLLSFVVLLVTLIVVVVKNHEFWFGSDDASVEEISPAPASKTVASTPAPATNTPAPASSNSVPAAQKSSKATTKNSEVASKAVEPVVAAASVIPGTRMELPPMEVEVVAGDSHRKLRPGSNSVLVEIPTKSGARSTDTGAFKWSPVTNAAEKTQIAANDAEAVSRVGERSYPSLDRQMKVQGSVLLQALVAADGGIRDLHVVSGNPILTSAALEAARQWRFRPYLQNGQPVETQAKIMVNFTIKIL
jgi:TonB family protein